MNLKFKDGKGNLERKMTCTSLGYKHLLMASFHAEINRSWTHVFFLDIIFIGY